MRIAVVRNRDRSGVIYRFGQPCSETYGEKTIEMVCDALRRYGHTVMVCEGDKNLLCNLETFFGYTPACRPEGMVFNMAYGIQGECRYTHVPALLEMAGIPYTGSSPLGHALALDKVITKDLIRQAGVSTPNYTVMSRPAPKPAFLRFPLVVKPRHESTSFGLGFALNQGELDTCVESVVIRYRQSALVEEYLPGREFCVGLLGNEEMEFLPIVEQEFGDRESRLMSWEDKNHKSEAEPVKICPADIPPSLESRLRTISLASFRACHCKDYARVDIRMDGAGNPFVLEINSMASLGASGSYVRAAKAAGYDFEALVNRILDTAHQRYAGCTASAGMLMEAPCLTGTRH